MFDNLRQELDADPALQQLREDAQVGRCGDKWKVVHNLLTDADRVYVPSSSAHIQTLLAATHNVGHEGMEKTLHRLHADFYILGTLTTLHDFARACAVCQCNKLEHLHPVGLL
jgi:hypothetical protein